MSFPPSKTNYVRPHGKASYIRPLNDYNENGNGMKNFPLNFEKSTRHQSLSPIDALNIPVKQNSLKSIDDRKEKHLQKLTSSHFNLVGEIEKIQSWRISVEMECKQKSKKIDELNQIAESQRKVVLDLQMQNEKLSMQLNEEMQQRVSVMEQFCSSKKLCTALKKIFHDLQVQFEDNKKIKEAVDGNNRGKFEVIENLTKKFNDMFIECTGKISYLTDALTNDKNTILMLKDMCEQQSATAVKEHKAHCNLIEKYKEEMNVICKEKDAYILRISQLESEADLNVKNLKDTEEQLRLTMDSKIEVENSYQSEIVKVNELNRKYKELEDFANQQKIENEENLIKMNMTINCLEKSVMEHKLKFEETKNKNINILVDLEKVEKEKFSLEDDILKIKKEKERIDEKLMINTKNAEDKTSLLKMENKDLYASLQSMKEDLHTTVLDKKNLTNLYAENEKKLSEIIDKYQDAVLKIEKLTLIQEKYSELKKEVKVLEDNVQRKTEQLDLKESKIKELEGKYNECLNSINELEGSLSTKYEELSLKDMKIAALSITEAKFIEAANKIKELEYEMKLKKAQILSDDMKINELSITEKKLVDATDKIKELEIQVELKQAQILSDDEELKSIKDKYAAIVAEVINLEFCLKTKSEILENKEKEIAELQNTLNVKEGTVYKLQYENIEMKDNLEREKDSVKVCLECELMNEKIKELDDLKLELNQTQEDLRKQVQLATDTMKMLSETEDNFDNMRVRKEKEIIKYKDNVQTLQHELKILKVQVGEIEVLRIENEQMKINMEEIALQNAGDLQRIKLENDMLKKDIGAFKTQKNLPLPVAENKNTPSQRLEKSNSQQTKTDEKMEADSSRDDSSFEKKKVIVRPLPALKRLYKPANKKTINSQKEKSPMASEKRKRMWESDSSGSECLEIVFDSEANKIKGFTPKTRFIDVPTTPKQDFMQDKKLHEANKIKGFTPKTRFIDVPTTPKQDFMQDKKLHVQEIINKEANKIKGFTPKTRSVDVPSTPKQDFMQDKKLHVQEIINKTPCYADNIKPVVINIGSQPTRTPMKTETDSDFLSSKTNITEVFLTKSPYVKRKTAMVPDSPSTPSQRKFFKTPLKEREFPFKKPQSNKKWF